MSGPISRRSFLKHSALGIGTGLAAAGGFPQLLRALDLGQGRRNADGGSGASGLPKRVLGRTGEEVGVLGLGGAIAVAEDRERAAAIVERALDLGVNYIDTAAQYGPSEANIGAVLKNRRAEAFLASKTHDRSYDGTMRLFERSLERLQTDYLDLYQLHAIHTEATWATVKDAGGALAAVRRLREEGAVRYIGISGHKNSPFLGKLLEEEPFDCVLLSLNAGDRHYDSMIENALPVAERRELGVIAMKVASYDGRIFREDGVRSMREALGYVLSFPVSTAIVGVSSVAELEENVAIATEHERLSEGELAKLEQRTAAYQREVNFFKHDW